MIPPNQGSILSQDASLNKTPCENCYIWGYEGPNEILQDIQYRAWTLIYVVKISDPEGEIVTHGSSYKFYILNSPEISHLGKMCINPNCWNKFYSNIWC